MRKALHTCCEWWKELARETRVQPLEIPVGGGEKLVQEERIQYVKSHPNASFSTLLGTLLVSNCCCNAFSGRKTTQIYYLTVLEVRSPDWLFPLETPGKNLFPAFSTSGGYMPSLAHGPFLYLQSQHCVFSLSLSLSPG